MATKITMPRLSDTMTEGTVAKWLKKVGDKVNEGDILAEIETDKATMEFESFNSGTLLHIGIQEGETAAVDALLAVIGNEGEDISGLIGGDGNSPSDTNEAKVTKDTGESGEVKDTEKDSHPESSEKEETGKAPAGAELPKGVTVVTMPRLSDTMTGRGTVAKWLKKVGDKVSEGDILAEIETDKATMEFESFNSGTLLHIGINEGESAPIDSVLAIIGPEGTDVSGMAENYRTGEKPAAAPTKGRKKEEDAAVPEEHTQDGKRIFISPLARKIAAGKKASTLAR